MRAFYIEITCHCSANADSFTRIAKCTPNTMSVVQGNRLSYYVEMFDDPNPKDFGGCLFYPPKEEDPQLWISERLASWLKMFLSYRGPQWLAVHGPIESDEAILRRIELEV